MTETSMRRSGALLPREEGRMAGEAQLRAAALLVLAAIAVTAPVHTLYDTSAFGNSTLIVQGLHAALAGAVLLASLTPLGRRHAHGLSLGLVLGIAVNVYVGLWLLPRVLPTYPLLAADALNFLMMGAAVFFSWTPRRVLLTCGMVWAGFALLGIGLAHGFPSSPFVLALASLVVGTTIAVFSARLLEGFRADLDRRHAELRALSARLMTIQEEERRRLSRELHDGLGQSLTAVSSYLWLIERRLPTELGDLRARTSDARQLVARTLGEMRELSQLLCPPILTLYGLVPSLDEHLKAFADRQQLRTRFHAHGVPARLPADVETAIYRITQEALTNVVRHARARAVRVAITADAHTIRLEIEDDGIGMPATSGPQTVGTGLIGISERVRALGGAMEIRSRPGTCLSVEIPRPESPEEAGDGRDEEHVAMLRTCAPRPADSDAA